MRNTRRVFSWLLLVSGLLLLIAGSREVVSSLFSQLRETEVWDEAEAMHEAEAHRERTPKARPRPTYSRGETMARFQIPRLGTRLPIVQGTGKAELRRAPGHLEGTELPGEPGNTVVAGHRDTHFRVLKDILLGDQIIVDHDGERLVYVVTNTKIVPPTERNVLMPVEGHRLTLVTCYPFYYLGPAPKRFIVQADLVERSAAELSRNM
jgi:LPXTG-site transpeptidase (sortase) family protein